MSFSVVEAQLRDELEWWTGETDIEMFDLYVDVVIVLCYQYDGLFCMCGIRNLRNFSWIIWFLK